MKKSGVQSLSGLIAAALLIFAVVNVKAESAEKVKKETVEAVDAAGVYASEKKEEFSARVKGNLDEIDREIEDLKKQTESKSAEVRDATKKKIQELEAKRRVVNERYQSLEKSTGKAWTRMKAGLEKAMGEVRSAYRDAKTELESSKKK